MKNATRQEERLQVSIAGAFHPSLPAPVRPDAPGANARMLAAGASPRLKHVLLEKTDEEIIAHGVLPVIIVRKEIVGAFTISQVAKTQKA